MGPMGIYGELIGTKGVSRVDEKAIAMAIVKVAMIRKSGMGRRSTLAPSNWIRYAAVMFALFVTLG